MRQDTDLSFTTIAPHWSSSYPEYLSPDWDKDTQQVVVWTRLQELRHKLANCSLAKVNKRFLALRQEQQSAQVESSHEPLSCDSGLSLCYVLPGLCHRDARPVSFFDFHDQLMVSLLAYFCCPHFLENTMYNDHSTCIVLCPVHKIISPVG